MDTYRETEASRLLTDGDWQIMHLQHRIFQP